MQRITTALLGAVLFAATVVGATAPAAAAPQGVASMPPTAFTPVAPVRALDTRESGTTLGPGTEVKVDLGAWIARGSVAVVLNLTGVNPTADTYVTAWQQDGLRPTASNLNLAPGQVRANLVTVSVGPAPDLGIYLYNFAGSVDLVVDVTGYYAHTSSDRYTPLNPQRVLDTRDTDRVGENGTVTVDFSPLVPPSATSVTFGLTGVTPTSATYVTAWPTGSPRPVASNLNLVAGAITPNLVTVPLGTDRRVTLYNFRGQVDLLADLAGYYAPGQGSLFTSTYPIRVLDTRSAGGPLGPNSSRTLPVPSSWTEFGYTTTAVVANITGVDATASTFLTAWPAGTPLPAASNLNLVPGEVAANLVAAAVNGDGAISLFNKNGAAHVVVDVAGHFVLPPTS